MSSCQGEGPGAIPGSRTIQLSIYDLRLTICFARISQTVFQTGRAPAVQQSFQNSACSGQHRGGLPNRKSEIINHKSIQGSWQTSNAPALQAG
jgi:hypothetical protein